MRRPVALSAAALAVAGLTGCGTNPFDASGQDGEAEAMQVDTAPPPYGEIHQTLFTTMLAAESVIITGQLEAGEAGIDQLFDGIDEDETGELRISGALDGSHSEMSFAAGGSNFTQIAVDGEEYFRGEDFAALLVAELDEEIAEEVDEEFIDGVVADSWVQFTDGGDGSIFSAEEFLTTWQSELDSEDVAEMTAEVEEREGEDVWVYTADAGDTEFVVTADEDEPYLMSIRDEDSSYEFTDWDTAETPDEPDTIISLDEIFGAIAEEQGWPVDEVTDDEGEDNGNDDDE